MLFSVVKVTHAREGPPARLHFPASHTGGSRGHNLLPGINAHTWVPEELGCVLRGGLLNFFGV